MELSYFAIIIGAIFVNNVVLAQFLGICPFLGATAARPNAEAGTRAAGEERYRERGLEREGRSNRLQRGSQTVNNAQEGGRNE